MDQGLFNRLCDYLGKNNNIVFAYVFGSFVNYDKFNDIDLGIFLADSRIDTLEYLNFKRELMDITSLEVDIVILNKANALIKREIFKDGVRLFSRNRELESDFIVHSLFEYEDMRKYYALSYNSMIKNIRKEVSTDG
ncbi:MAG: nucleotidyltransferase domain-containing protein [Alkaliphilus sp.]|nr:nucleotidyltransferase domain-containing protein [Alkaliphilus sp.]